MLTKMQIAVLRFLIFTTQHGTELTKRVMAYLIDQSRGLTLDVCLTLIEDRDGYSADEIRDAAFDLDVKPIINQILLEMGSNLHFSLHFGDYDPNRNGKHLSSAGQFAGLPADKVSGPPDLTQEGFPVRYTFWLARQSYLNEATYVGAGREVLGLIDLEKSGLSLSSSSE